MSSSVMSLESNELPIIKGLNAKGPDPELREKLTLFGQFIGDWDPDVWMKPPDGPRMECKAEVHFGWILGGKGVQDLWIFQNQRKTIGTTVRFYDPKLDAWRCVWANPVSGIMETLIARESDEGIVLEGTTQNGHQQ